MVSNNHTSKHYHDYHSTLLCWLKNGWKLSYSIAIHELWSQILNFTNGILKGLGLCTTAMPGYSFRWSCCSVGGFKLHNSHYLFKKLVCTICVFVSLLCIYVFLSNALQRENVSRFNDDNYEILRCNIMCMAAYINDTQCTLSCWIVARHLSLLNQTQWLCFKCVGIFYPVHCLRLAIIWGSMVMCVYRNVCTVCVHVCLCLHMYAYIFTKVCTVYFSVW